MLAYAGATMLLPNEITYEQAAPIFCAGYTVWSGLRAADPKPHERIAIIGIGGLGHLGGADIIFVTSNSYKPALDALKGLRPEGRMIIMGFSNEPFNISAFSLFFNRHHIIGSQQNGIEYLYEALDYVAKGKVKVMTETFSLEDISQAYDRVANGQVRFRAVIKN
jgi:alcohol dehydrogenase